jgi:signal peptide peptidase SppA
LVRATSSEEGGYGAATTREQAIACWSDALGLQSARSSSASVPTVAVLPIRGLVMQHQSYWTEIGVATSTDQLAAQLTTLSADSSVAAIVLDIDSPGGGVYGVDEAAAVIREVRATTPVIAVANAQAASAAYWLASAASEVVVTPSGEVGSIGVFAEHWDASGWYERLGVKPTLVRAGRYKAEFADIGPLSDEALEELQRLVDENYDRFIAAVAKGRGVSLDTVRGDFGEGRMLTAKAAVRAGMADRVESLPDTLSRVARARRAPTGVRASELGPDLETRRRRLRLAEREG